MTNLRFKNYQFAHNPRHITVRYTKNIAECLCAGFGAAIQQMGPGLTIVEGEGEFFGGNAMEQFNQLKMLLAEAGSGTLVGAGIEPMKAVFKELNMLGKGGEEEITYAFKFIQERTV